MADCMRLLQEGIRTLEQNANFASQASIVTDGMSKPCYTGLIFID